MNAPKRKLIEVGIPLKIINESRRGRSRSATATPRRCICGGPPSVGRRPSCSVRPTRGRPFRQPERFPTEEDQDVDVNGSTSSSNSSWPGRTPTTRKYSPRRVRRSSTPPAATPADPRPVRWRRDNPTGSATAGAGGPRLRPQPSRRPHRKGTDRNPPQVRAATTGVTRTWPPQQLRTWQGAGAGRGRPRATGMDARRSRKAHRTPLPEGDPARRYHRPQ